MFETLSEKLQRVFKNLRGEGRITEQHLEEAAFGLNRCMGYLRKHAAHLPVALGRTIRLRYFSRLLPPRTAAHPGRQFLSRREGGRLWTYFGNHLLRRIGSLTRHLGQPHHRIIVLV